MSVNITYDHRLVAFLDVMGFKELLRGNDVSPALQGYYDRVVKHLGEKRDAYAVHAREHELRKLLVSDSIILSIKFDCSPAEKLKRAANFFHSIAFTQYVLAMECDIWIRGAVSVGQLHIDEEKNILVGPAFVSAYELEKSADYPRVIIDPKVCADMQLLPNELIEKVNAQAYATKIIEPPQGSRFGLGEFPFDAIQIDWFALHFSKDLNHSAENYFGGIHRRMLQSQSLFQKSRLLCKYLRESYCFAISDRGVDETERSTYVDARLKRLGF